MINEHELKLVNEMSISIYRRGYEDGVVKTEKINDKAHDDGYSKGLDDRKKEIEKARKEGYDEGVTDTIFNIDTYKQGLNDAWECARKILADVVDGGFDSDTLKQIFGTPIISDVFKINSACRM